MLARCPSCTSEVDEDADICPTCGWDFIKRIKRLDHNPPAQGASPPAAKAPPPKTEPPKPAPKTDAPKSPPAKGAPPAGEAGRGLLQFPKIEHGARQEVSPDSPFAIPAFGRAQEPEPAEKASSAKPAEPPAQEKDKPKESKGPPPARRLEPAPLAAELEDLPPPPPPKTIVSKKAAPEPPKGKEPPRKPEPQRKAVPSGAPSKPGPMGVYIGLASAAVLLVAGAGIYMLSRSSEPKTTSASPTSGHPFAPGATGVTPIMPPSSPQAPAKPAPPVYNPEPEIKAEPELPPPPPRAVAKPRPAPAPVQPVAARPEPPPPPPAPAPPPAAPSWKFEGTVYDIINLKPVAGATMTFRGGGKEFSCVSDKRGRYKISVDAISDGTYSLGVSQKAYLDGYVDETSPPLAELEADERRGIAASNAKNDPWVGDPKKATKRDCYLVPQNLTESAQ